MQQHSVMSGYDHATPGLRMPSTLQEGKLNRAVESEIQHAMRAS